MLYGYRYNTLCQPCSSLTYCRFTFQVWLIKSPARSNVQSSRIFVHGFAVYHTQVFYLELSTFNRYRVMFRLKLCSPQLFCFFLSTFIWTLSGIWNARIPKYCLLFTFLLLIEKIAMGKKLRVSVLEHIYG